MLNYSSFVLISVTIGVLSCLVAQWFEFSSFLKRARKGDEEKGPTDTNGDFQERAPRPDGQTQLSRDNISTQ